MHPHANFFFWVCDKNFLANHIINATWDRQGEIKFSILHYYVIIRRGSSEKKKIHRFVGEYINMNYAWTSVVLWSYISSKARDKSAISTRNIQSPVERDWKKFQIWLSLSQFVQILIPRGKVFHLLKFHIQFGWI